MSIGVVIKCLSEEFPDVTVSKIRFLESEGLISPERTQSGYRRFTEADVERLRYILITQRDNYLPLKVIREQLEAMDSGKVSKVSAVMAGQGAAEPLIAPEQFAAPLATRLSDQDVAEQADCSAEVVAQCIDAGLIVPDSSGMFTADDVRVVSTAVSLTEFGLDTRHLKRIRQSASRQADLIEQVTEPVAKSGRAAAKQEAGEISQQMTALVVSLHAALVKNELRRGLA
ncbi:MerR family transcriptional regulator [Corynebacterium sp. P4-C1]|nr:MULTISPECIES: MerR family transcriptional regulator [unclassified Corynebacterium]MCT1452919.1 MerR family transcriptional regulator [Corynebacterium sp. p3-SID1145]MCT1461946.1 MerR family transcriptional regulator [Corynebacterium sp. p3-SID1140]MDN8594692.1 MerR family transcriptional regulator [Corynebacterium sp. P4_F2]WKK56681.1 MerR family transcriptional regulator [Corynebacterium sp. P4-C1]WKK64458.1 MerR family transcriptional regulator [Corynebacterium sp. P8-C1]